MPSKRFHQSRRGLSLAELIIGMAVTGVTLMALSGFVVAVSQSWRNSNDVFKTSNSATVAKTQMSDALGTMLYVVQNKKASQEGDSSYVFFWANDALVADDNLAQFGEMGLLEYDPTGKSVKLYKAKPFASMSADEKTLAQSSSWGDARSTAIIDYFKASGVVGTPTVVVGSASDGGVNYGTIEYFAPSGAKPLTNYELSLSDGGSTVRAYGSVSMRAARVPTNLN